MNIGKSICAVGKDLCVCGGGAAISKMSLNGCNSVGM